MPMTITYKFENSLYVNFTNRCTNDCIFCLRNGQDTVNGTDNLWLDHEPTLEEIKADFKRRDMSEFDSIVFCGYGEPLMRFDTCIELAKWLKAEYTDIRIRINTNGQANLIEKRDITPEFKGLIDSLSISLNAPDPTTYDNLCKSIYGEAAFEGILDFAKKASKVVPNVILSVVDRDLTEEQIQTCRELATECGCLFRVREYIE